MCDVLSTLQWKQQNDSSKKLADALMGDNPLAALSTENNLASALAPFAQIFCDTSLLTFLGGRSSQKLWRALVANTVYWTVRRAIGDEDRSEVLKNLVNFREENFTHPLGDLEDEPANVNIHNSWDIKSVTEFITKNKYLHNNKLYMNLLELAKKFTAAGNKITPDIFTPVQNKAKMDPIPVGMDFDIFCHVEIVKSIQTRNETERYSDESIGFHKSEEAALTFLKSTVEDLYRKQYDTELKEKLDRVKEAKLQNFLEIFTTMKFDEFTKKLHENVPNQSSKGMSEMIGKLGNDKENIVDKVAKVEHLLTGRLGEITWNNGSVSRNGSGALLAILEPLVSDDKFAAVKDYVDKNAWHRYRDVENRQGHGNQSPSFWAATNYVDPWSFLKNDSLGYKQFLRTLAGLDGGEEKQQMIYNEWKHLLQADPNKHDVTAGKQMVSGKEKKKNRKRQVREMHSQRKKTMTG